jgi:hypothetical protein
MIERRRERVLLRQKYVSLSSARGLFWRTRIITVTTAARRRVVAFPVDCDSELEYVQASKYSILFIVSTGS